MTLSILDSEIMLLVLHPLANRFEHGQQQVLPAVPSALLSLCLNFRTDGWLIQIKRWFSISPCSLMSTHAVSCIAAPRSRLKGP